MCVCVYMYTYIHTYIRIDTCMYIYKYFMFPYRCTCILSFGKTPIFCRDLLLPPHRTRCDAPTSNHEVQAEGGRNARKEQASQHHR